MQKLQNKNDKKKKYKIIIKQRLSENTQRLLDTYPIFVICRELITRLINIYD